MNLRDKNILIISPESWDHIPVSKHHYAIELSKVNKVFFLNPPEKTYRIVQSRYPGLYVLDYPGFISGMRFFPQSIRRLLVRSVLSRLQKLSGVTFDIVWSFDNSVFYDFHFFDPSVFTICHLVDLNQNFNFKTAAASANLCLTTNQIILDKFLKHNNNSFFIDHGVAIFPSGDKPFVLPGKNKIKVGYAGNLDIRYLDWEVLTTIVDGNPDVDFIFAGPWNNHMRREEWLIRENFSYIGVVDTVDLARFYRSVDLLLVCYQADLFPEQLANPHKMMEYLSSGTMICATHSKVYESVANDGLIVMSNANRDFQNKFRECINNLHHWNNEALVSARRQLALGNSYAAQIAKIESLIKTVRKE